MTLGRWTMLARPLTAVLLAAALMAPAGAAAAPAGAHPARATVARVKISGFAFKPSVLHIAKGTKVIWTNRDSVGHTTTSNKGVWDSGTIAPGDTFSRVFKKAGTFAYHCSIHPDMKGKIVVG